MAPWTAILGDITETQFSHLYDGNEDPHFLELFQK